MAGETKHKKHMSAVHIACDAVLAAMVVALGYYAIDLGNNKLTLESLPVLTGALLLGPADGLLIGGVGNLLYQILRYGFSATTLLWILPHMVQGLTAGLYGKCRGFRTGRKQCIGIALGTELLTTLLNTGVIAADALIYGYYTGAYVFGSLVMRLLICAGKGIAYGMVLPEILKVLRKTGITERGNT